jgi:hypothetical protein
MSDNMGVTDEDAESMIDCTCKKWPDYRKGEDHEYTCPYHFLEERQG